MYDLCADIGYSSLYKYGEELCGDHVEVVHQEDGETVVVLADGLGSGVKANILSTMTAKIISTMMAARLSIEECVSTIALTLPVCAVRKVAYSTFTILRLTPNDEAELIQYDNPKVILLRDGESVDYPSDVLNIDGKTILKSRIPIREGDVFVAISDGVLYAGIGKTMNMAWKREDVIDFIKTFFNVGYTAKTLTTILLDQCLMLYGGRPGDDAAACVVKVRKRQSVNLLIGPPAQREDCHRMMSLFFSKAGKHIICGGTTASIAAEYLDKPLVPKMEYLDKDVPPIADIEGVDLVTEGIITINKVLTYAKDHLKGNETYRHWSISRDGASRIARILFEDATDINFYVGCAVNPAHQNPDLPIKFSIKMRLVDELAECLKQMSKSVKISYF